MGDARAGRLRRIRRESGHGRAGDALPVGYTLLRTIQMRDLAGPGPVFFGFLAVGGSPRAQVIALRGTATPAEWVDDLHWAPVPFPQAGSGRVTEGFLDLYGTLTSAQPGQSALVAGTAGLTAVIDPTLPLVVTGHSLGAALATCWPPTSPRPPR